MSEVDHERLAAELFHFADRLLVVLSGVDYRVYSNAVREFFDICPADYAVEEGKPYSWEPSWGQEETLTEELSRLRGIVYRGRQDDRSNSN